MTYFEPPPLPGHDRGEPAARREPVDPYASTRQEGWPGPAPAAPWGAPAQLQHPQGTVVLVLGILSVTVLQLLGPVAWIMGHRALREINTSGQAYANRSSVQAGMIMGIVGTVMCFMMLAWFMAVVAAVITTM